MKKRLVKSFPSKINGYIELYEKNGEYLVEVDSFTESGHNVQALWEEVFDSLVQDDAIKRILVLGFGAGSVMHAIRARWPNSTVTGVEIDPVMLKIAHKYFPANCADVTIHTADATSFIRKQPDVIAYDLIIVDCYIGGNEPSSVKTIKFLRKLKRIGTHILINQLFIPKSKLDFAKLAYLKELDTLFKVRTMKLPFNIIIEY